MGSTVRRGWTGIVLGMVLLIVATITWFACNPRTKLGTTSYGRWAQVSYPMPTRPNRTTSNGGLVVNLSILFAGLSIWAGVKRLSQNPTGWDL